MSVTLLRTVEWSVTCITNSGVECQLQSGVTVVLLTVEWSDTYITNSGVECQLHS